MFSDNASLVKVSKTWVQRVCNNVIRNVDAAQLLHNNETIDNELIRRRRWWKWLFRFFGLPAPTRESTIESLKNNLELDFCGIFPSVVGEAYKERAKQLLLLARVSVDDCIYIFARDVIIFDCEWGK